MELRHVVAIVAGLMLSFLIGAFGFFFPFLSGTAMIFTMAVIIGLILGYLFHLLSKWSPEGHSFVALSLMPMVGVLIGILPVPFLRNFRMQASQLSNLSSTGEAAAGTGGGLLEVFTGPDPLLAIPFLLIPTFIISYWVIIPHLKKGDKKDLLWLLLPLVAAAIALGIGWLIGSFFANNIVPAY